MTTEVKTCFLAMYISFFYFFISFAFLLLICLFFLSSKNFKNNSFNPHNNPEISTVIPIPKIKKHNK